MIYIFEGMDNCLKDTLIQLLRSHLTPKTQVLKFSNPPKNIKSPEDWQKEHFQDMFDLMKLNLKNDKRNLILNRAHLGEYVYSPIYRGYEGGWIFDLEESFLLTINNNQNKIKLFVLIDSDNDQLNLREDGKSFSESNYLRLNQERAKFVEAYKKSGIQNKYLFDLSNYQLKKTNHLIQIDTISILKKILEL